jgi:long-chain acyl-CoA synthetase
MLYERWRQVAQQRGSEFALSEIATGERWTFGQLASKAAGLPAPSNPIICPQGHGARFILDVLVAWRFGAVVCPLEPHERAPAVSLPPRPCCHLKTTSATTGAPRFVVFRPEQLAADADQIVRTMGLRPDWPNLGVISLAHSYGFSNLVLPLLLHGIPLIIVPAPLPEVVRRAAAALPEVTLPAVPALWHAWHTALATPPNVRLAISAGAPLNTALERAVFERSDLKIHNFYGSTECGGIAYDRSSVPRSDDAYVGQPMEKVNLTLNGDGCLCVHSRAAGEFYWPEPSDALRRGCFQTSDLAEIKGREVFLQGRLGDQINVAGRKVSPATIEGALRRHPLVNDCLVFSVPGGLADRAERIVACVVAGGKLPTPELRQFLLGILPAWQVPREWWFVDSLTVNQRGKLSRTEWRRRFLEHISASHLKSSKTGLS